MAIFEKKSNPDYKMSTDQGEENNTGYSYSNLVSKVKGYMKLTTNDAESSTPAENLPWHGRLKASILQSLEVEKSYKLFFMVLAVGLAIIGFSTVFIILSPQKFVALFSLGSLVTLNSFIFLNGTFGHFEMLFSKNRLPFTIMYLISIVLGTYFSFSGSFILSMVCSAFQLVSLIVFVLSFIPGGRYGISMIFNLLSSPFRSIFSKFSG